MYMLLFVDFFKKLFNSNGFMPRWNCGIWESSHGWLYILSDINIGISYLGIPIILLYFIRKRKDVPFSKLFILFSLFIVFCGLTHITDAIMFWYPLYRLNAVLLFITAIISTVTIVVLYRIIPEALSLKSSSQLQKIIDVQTNELQLYNEKLKASEQQFKALVNMNPDVITLIGRDYKYKFINDSLCLLYDIDINSFIGKTPIDAQPDNTNTLIFIDKIKESFETGKRVVYSIESKPSKKGLRYFTVEIIPILDKNGEPQDVLTISKDITTIRDNELQMNNTIQRLDRLTKRLEFKRNVLQDFAYIVSHNLRSPTGNLAMLIEIFKRTKNEEKKSELLEKFFSVSKQLSNTVHNLSDVVNINQNAEMERSEMSFESVLSSIIISLSAQISVLNAQINYDFSACETINYPKVYLESILLNLLTNALKYASPMRTPIISFTTEKLENGLIILKCKDNGLGIDLERYGNKIFVLHKTFHNNPDAKGIGLFITKHQIRSLGGNITVESEPDKGATFIIKFNEIEVL